jgi:hypothetical protein
VNRHGGVEEDTGPNRAALAISVMAGLILAVLVVVFFANRWNRIHEPGLFWVANRSDHPIIVQMPGPLNTGHAYLLQPGQHGPYQDRVRFGIEISIYTADCRPLIRSHVEGGDQWTVYRSDGSTEIDGIPHQPGQPEFAEVDRCPPIQEGDASPW